MCVTLSSCVLLHADLTCFRRTHFYTVRLVLFRKISVKICPFVQRFKCLYDSCYIYFLAHAVLRIHFCKLQGTTGSPLKAIMVMCVMLRRCNELLENQLTFYNYLQCPFKVLIASFTYLFITNRRFWRIFFD